MINYFLVKSNKTGLYYTVTARDYAQATNTLKGHGFWLDNWNVIFSGCSDLVKFRGVCSRLTITKTNIIEAPARKGRNLV